MNEIELKQTLFLVMGNLFHEARQYLDLQFKKYNLTRPEWLILALLRTHKDGISQAFAKSYMGLEVSYLSKVLNELEEKGFIIREINPNDRRNRIIKPNPKASTKIKKLFNIIYELNEVIQSDLTEKQMHELHKSLHYIAERLKKFKDLKRENLA